MPRHDYVCPTCGAVLLDQYRSVSEGAQAHPPVCADCDGPMAWIPGIGRMDAFEPGQEFTTYDGQNQPVMVESFAQMRKLEAESMQQYRNGEGQPIRFRALHQDHSNMDRNTFGEAPHEKPSREAVRKFAPRAVADADHAYGPGVNDSNTSALKG